MWSHSHCDVLVHNHTQDPMLLSREQLEDAFLKAAQTGVLEVVKELHELCGDDILSVRDEDQYTPLHRASYNGHTDVAEYLLYSGANIEARTMDGWQPIHCACRWNKVRTASLLLQNGALVNSKTNGGQTPLHLAASNDRAKPTLELLLRHRDIDPSLLNGQSETALQLAERNGRFSYLFLMVDESIDHRKFLKELEESSWLSVQSPPTQLSVFDHITAEFLYIRLLNT